MKTYFTSLLGTITLSCLLATAASCSDQQKDPSPTIKTVEVHPGPAVNPVPERTLPPTEVAASPLVASSIPAPVATDPFTQASSALEKATRDQSASLNSVPDTLSRGIDANISAWKAKGGNSTSTGESKLELARTDFIQKVQTLTLADEETWKNAKTTAQASLESLRQAYDELMEAPNHT